MKPRFGPRVPVPPDSLTSAGSSYSLDTGAAQLDGLTPRHPASLPAHAFHIVFAIVGLLIASVGAVALALAPRRAAYCALGTLQRPSARWAAASGAAAEGPWFVKTETFKRPFPEVKPHLEAHRAWVAQLRAAGQVITSGYRVDAEGRPGGGGLMIFAATNHAAAEALVKQDPLIANDCVDWQLNRWIPEVGCINVV